MLLVSMVNVTGSFSSSVEVLSRVLLSMIFFSSFLRDFSQPLIFRESFVRIISIALLGGGGGTVLGHRHLVDLALLLMDQ
jgi:hypothetical protein